MRDTNESDVSKPIHQSDLEAVATAERAESLLHSQRQSLDEGVQVDHAVVHRLDHSQQLAQRLLQVSLPAHHVRALLQVLQVTQKNRYYQFMIVLNKV